MEIIATPFPVRVGYQGPLHLNCPLCGHIATPKFHLGQAKWKCWECLHTYDVGLYLVLPPQKKRGHKHSKVPPDAIPACTIMRRTRWSEGVNIVLRNPADTDDDDDFSDDDSSGSGGNGQ